MHFPRSSGSLTQKRERNTQQATNPKGTVYFTLDSGNGSKYYKYDTTADHSFSTFGWQNNVPAYTYAKVTDVAIFFTTYAVNSDKPIDTYTITKTAVAASSPLGSSVSTVKASGGTASNPKTGDSGDAASVIMAILACAVMLAGLSAAMIFRKKSVRR